MTESYFTVKSASKGLFKDRGSKFYSFVFHVSTEDEIRTHLEQLRKEYHDARHHCYAWRLKPDHSLYRSNDDGEPSSSAGKPILTQIEARELTNVLVVVIRYFGGTLLGVGGLINAYKSAAADALEKCTISKKYVYHSFEVRFDYSQMNSVMKIIKDHELKNYDHEFEMTCSLKFDVRIDKAEGVLKLFDTLRECKVLRMDE